MKRHCYYFCQGYCFYNGNEVELDARDNGHCGVEDISHENPAHEGGYLDNFDLVKPNSYVIVNENTNEEKKILSTCFKNFGDEWYIDEEYENAVYKFRK